MLTQHKARWALASLLLISGGLQAQLTINPTNEHPNPYDADTNYFDLPGDREWGSTSAVDIDPDGE